MSFFSPVAQVFLNKDICLLLDFRVVGSVIGMQVLGGKGEYIYVIVSHVCLFFHLYILGEKN